MRYDSLHIQYILKLNLIKHLLLNLPVKHEKYQKHFNKFRLKFIVGRDITAINLPCMINGENQ